MCINIQELSTAKVNVVALFRTSQSKTVRMLVRIIGVWALFKLHISLIRKYGGIHLSKFREPVVNNIAIWKVLRCRI